MASRFSSVIHHRIGSATKGHKPPRGGHPSRRPIITTLCLLQTAFLLLNPSPTTASQSEEASEKGQHAEQRRTWATLLRGIASVPTTFVRPRQPASLFPSKGAGTWGMTSAGDGDIPGVKGAKSGLKRVDLTRVEVVQEGPGTNETGALRQEGRYSLQCHVSACPDLSRCTLPGNPKLAAGVDWCRQEDIVGVSAPNRHPNRTLGRPVGPLPSVHPHNKEFNALDLCFTVQLGHVTAIGPPPHLVRPECHVLLAEERRRRRAGTREGGEEDGAVDPTGASSGESGVFVVENVFLDSFGRVFNATHQFHTGGCSPWHEVSYDPDTPTMEVESVVNLIGASIVPGKQRDKDSQRPDEGRDHASSLQTTAYELPLALLVAATFPLARGTILATHHRKFHHIVTSQFLAEESRESFRALRKETPQAGTLWLVKRLVQPAFQSCNNLSIALWERSRKQHLLHKDLAAALTRVESQAQETLPLVPPSAPMILPDWRILVHQHVLSSVSSKPPLAALVTQFFSPQQVVVSPRGLSVEEDQSLFARTPLFVTTTSAPSSFSNIVFMPPLSTVLLFHGTQDPYGDSDASGLVETAVQLAAACQVRLYLLRCSIGAGLFGIGATGDGRVECDAQAILEVLDRVAIDVYTVVDPPTLNRPPDRPTTMDLAPGDPAGRRELAMGSKPADGVITRQRDSEHNPLQPATAGQLAAYQEWADCVSSKGKWVLNSTQRRLPWEYRAVSASLCDKRHAQNGGISGTEAEAVVANGGSAAEWAVRDSVKYEWQVPEGACPAAPEGASSPDSPSFASFSPEDFCQSVGKGRTFLFLGDSLTEQTVASFLNLMLMGVPKPAEWAVSYDIPRECREWLPEDSYKAKHPYCGRYRFANLVCPGLEVYFVRNDYLTLPNPRSEDRMQFSRFRFVADADVIVLNRGAHYEEDDKYARDLTAVLRYLRNRFPEAQVIFRNTPPGHIGCDNISEPLTTRQSPVILPKPFGWGRFQEQNQIAKAIVQEYGHLYMDVDTMTSLRGDGHKGIRPWNGKEDCLHYCLPGPIDSWNQLLYNTLLRVAPIRV